MKILLREYFRKYGVTTQNTGHSTLGMTTKNKAATVCGSATPDKSTRSITVTTCSVIPRLFLCVEVEKRTGIDCNAQGKSPREFTGFVTP